MAETRAHAAVVVPVKAFAAAKVRLASALSASERARLARDLAGRVVAAAAPLPVFVVCDSTEVKEWAAGAGAEVLWCPGLGLNGAVAAGVAHLAAAGLPRAVVAHADLPLAEGLASLAGGTGVTLVPDRHDDGTNVVVVPSAAGFRFSYGPRSFSRHRAEAARLGLGLRVLRPPALVWDVDVPADLDWPRPPQEPAPCG